ncbi:hypothetical protein [Streptomyces sp. NPDC017993]|uniref:hypothetical protein n=1 Tax=Streptomyces sp. NPDC017993 TaxID=3365027 RepID=UPI0037A6E9FE
MTRSRAMNVCLATAGAGILAAMVRVLMQPAAALPRWDLLACLALTSAGIAGALLLLRRDHLPASGREETSRYWWPDRNGAWISAALFFGIIVPIYLFGYAALSPSPEATRIVEAGGGIRAVAVQDVLSSEYVRSKHSGHYEYKARVSVPFDTGSEAVTAEFDSDYRVDRGDKVWALYAPSAVELGALADGDRDVLQEESGGSAQPATYALVLLVTGLFLSLGALFGGFARAGRKLKVLGENGRGRSVAVTVTGVDVTLDREPPKPDVPRRPHPRIRMTGPAGEPLEIFLDPAIDPPGLDRQITGLQAGLFWIVPSPEYLAKGHKAFATLVLEGRRCVRGWFDTAEGAQLPEGAVVSASDALPDWEKLRAIRTCPVWNPRIHAAGLWALLIGVLALAVIACGVGTAATVLLAVTAYVSAAVGRVMVKSRRTRYLRSLLPGPGA